MEAVIVIVAALMVIVLLDASYHIALCLLRWAPSLLSGLLVGCLAHRQGMDPIEGTTAAALTMLLVRRVLLSMFLHHEEHMS